MISRREGYLLIDHQASPGIPADLAGALHQFVGEGKVLEAATLTCSHCKCVVMKNPLRMRERPFCRKCMHYICDICEAASYRADYTHESFDKVVDQTINRIERIGPSPVLLP